MTKARYRAIVAQEHVPNNGEWRAWTNALWVQRRGEDTMTREAFEAGLRATIRARKRKGLKGLFANTMEPITPADVLAEIQADPRLKPALEELQGHSDHGQGYQEKG